MSQSSFVGTKLNGVDYYANNSININYEPKKKILCITNNSIQYYLFIFRWPFS